jgi:hypothetical protein
VSHSGQQPAASADRLPSSDDAIESITMDSLLPRFDPAIARVSSQSQAASRGRRSSHSRARATACACRRRMQLPCVQFPHDFGAQVVAPPTGIGAQIASVVASPSLPSIRMGATDRPIARWTTRPASMPQLARPESHANGQADLHPGLVTRAKAQDLLTRRAGVTNAAGASCAATVADTADAGAAITGAAQNAEPSPRHDVESLVGILLGASGRRLTGAACAGS